MSWKKAEEVVEVVDGSIAVEKELCERGEGGGGKG